MRYGQCDVGILTNTKTGKNKFKEGDAAMYYGGGLLLLIVIILLLVLVL
jgi:hypothetical protein